MSSLKADLSGGLFIMQSNSYEAIAAYLNSLGVGSAPSVCWERGKAKGEGLAEHEMVR